MPEAIAEDGAGRDEHGDERKAADGGVHGSSPCAFLRIISSRRDGPRAEVMVAYRSTTGLSTPLDAPLSSSLTAWLAWSRLPGSDQF